ncbi:MAG: LytTR family transcriptional regulator DNA-binding domain-containing protein [Clostridia bacterium]|nr:LytTR family transcriptional regulator DNA-binding domain-containing protein [Clostridia bacterium]
MLIKIIEDPNVARTEIRVVCRKRTPELYDELTDLGVIADTFVGRIGNDIHFIELQDILYFETVDDNIFFYTEKEVYQTNLRLYIIEETLENTLFQRISKSIIVNLRKVSCIQPAEHSKLVAILRSGEKLIVSRHYVHEIKEKLRCGNV